MNDSQLENVPLAALAATKGILCRFSERRRCSQEPTGIRLFWAWFAAGGGPALGEHDVLTRKTASDGVQFAPGRSTAVAREANGVDCRMHNRLCPLTLHRMTVSTAVRRLPTEHAFGSFAPRLSRGRERFGHLTGRGKRCAADVSQTFHSSGS